MFFLPNCKFLHVIVFSTIILSKTLLVFFVRKPLFCMLKVNPFAYVPVFIEIQFNSQPFFKLFRNYIVQALSVKFFATFLGDVLILNLWQGIVFLAKGALIN